MRRALTRPRLRSLLAIHRGESGGPLAAQTLNRIAASVGVACGGAKYVPELVTASAALSGLHISEPPTRRLGIDYGPFLGVTCAGPGSTRCDRVGIDLVLRHRADTVIATVGGRRLRLRTPGLHTGVKGRDWLGYVHRAGLERAGSPFRLPGGAHGSRKWEGDPPVYVPVSLAISYSGGRQTLSLQRVRLGPGWG